MASPDRIAALAAELDAALPVLDRINSFYDRFQRKQAGAGRTVENAIIVSDVMVSFYTCLETAFLRISQFFENALDDARWHEQLLRAMTWTVPEVRERVISDATFAALSELRRFRHFKRYYFSFDYDWDRLELVRSKYLACRDPVRGELVAYSGYLQRIARDARESEPQQGGLRAGPALSPRFTPPADRRMIVLMAPNHPSIFLGAEPGPSRRSLDQLRDTIASPYGARLWDTVRQGAKESAGTDPLLPGTALPGRPAEQIQHANADNTICQAVVRRLLRDSLVYLVTGEERYRQDALTQIEALFDPKRWPQWLDFAHEMFQADLRTGQLGAAVALTYDWLYEHLSAAERAMIVEGLDRCAIRPYLATVPTDPHWLTRPSNWMTVVVGGLGIVGMVLGSEHDRSDLLVEMAQPRMEQYLTVLGPKGEFNESVGYSGSMQYPVRYFAARHSVTGGQDDRLAGHPFPQFCRWLMHVTVPPGHTIPFGDSHAQGPLLIGYFGPIASATRDGLLQWFMETHGLLHDPAADLTQVDVVDLLWYDPTLAATPPVGDAADDSDLPLGAAFPGWGGLVASRSSWADPDAVVVHGKAGREPIHEHQDDGQLIIHAGEAPLIIDLGSPSSYPADFFGDNRARYYNASVRGHNLLQVGGREMRFEKPIEGTFLHTAFGEHGAAWSIDLTGAHRDVVRVHRHVIHLLPDLVAVLDECEMTRAEAVTLRWHTADRALVDAAGCFRVQAAGPRGPVHLLGQICALSGCTATFRRDEHQYHAPYDRTRLDEPLEQRRESFVAAETNASRCRLLTLFLVVRPGGTLPAWPTARDGDTWRMPHAGAGATVTVSAADLTASAAGGSVRVPLAT